MRIVTLADRKEERCSETKINTDRGPRTTDYGPRIRRLSGLSQRTWAQNRNTPGRNREGSPEAFAEFGVGFIQRGIVLFCGIGMDRGLPSACRSFITNHRGTRGGLAISSFPRCRELYGESSIALLFRRQVCDHRYSQLCLGLLVEGMLRQILDLAEQFSQGGQCL